MDFKNQISNLELLKINNPKVYLKWRNTEKGRELAISWKTIENYFEIFMTSGQTPMPSIPSANAFGTTFLKIL